ncbi:MAG: DsrE/DsrF/DrsH-like family protein [Dehalococcoidia bacterium]|jgi:predicted peroxiredoxin
MAITAITVNGSEPSNIFPAMILGSAAAATGDDVTIFFTPSGAPVMLKGELEKIEAKGMPNIVELYEGLQILGGKILVCELALGAKDLKAEDFREGVEIVGATTFLASISGASITLSF